MNITDKVLSIPPYISASWKNILSLHVEPRSFGHVLIIELITQTKVEVPNLDHGLIEKIFACHAKVMESDEKNKNSSVVTATIPFPFLLPNLEGLTSMIQHNADQKDTPPFPHEMLERIAEMAKNILPENISSLQQPEHDCNCPHCQIMRAILGNGAEAPLLEEEVSEEDLKFRLWDIKQEDDKVYSVINPLDHKEHYNVFLGEPIGCTCGNNNCEHIQAVLKS